MVKLMHCGNALLGEQFLPPAQFAFQRTQRTGGVRQAEIRYVAHAVRQFAQQAECRAALEIKEHKMQAVRRIEACQRQAP